MKDLYKIYDSIRLNLGIKKFLREKVFTESYICSIDNNVLYPVYELLEKYFYKRVVYHYGADYRWGDEKSQNLDKKKNNFGYGLYHYALIRNQRPTRILCIGSMYGFIPYMMAKACRENKKGHVDFVDADFDMKKNKGNNYYSQGFWNKVKGKGHFNYLNAGKYVTTHIMTSKDFAKKSKEKYDYIYLDGDHSYKGGLENFKLYWPRLKKEGFIVLHDIHFDRILRGMLFEHGKMWKDLEKMPFKFELSNHYSGLGFIQKLTNDNPLRFLKNPKS